MQGTRVAVRESTTQRRRWVRGSLLAILIAVMGHVYYWYWPRLRPATPSAESPVALLVLEEGGAGVRLWVPYPHQTLTHVDRQLADLEAVGEAAEQLFGLAAPRLPTFGPFPFPPAREMAVVADSENQELTAMASVYPLAARLFRVAGWLADNPWMAGGELELQGRKLRIEWQDDLWLATTLSERPRTGDAETSVGQCAALLRVPGDTGHFPAGLLRLLERGSGWLLTTTLEGDPESWAARLEPWRSAGVAVSWSHIGSADGRTDVRSLLVTSESSGSGGLPPLVSIESAESEEASQLPGQRLLEPLGVQVHRHRRGSWILRSYDENLLAIGEVVAERLDRAEALTGIRGSTLGHVDLNEASRALLEVAEALRAVPILGEREATEWLTLAELLASLPVGSGLTVVVGPNGELQVEIGRQSGD